MEDDGGPAFPTENEHQSSANTYHYPGMMLRDYFAAHAPDAPTGWRCGDRKVGDVVAWRWAYADAMLKARNK